MCLSVLVDQIVLNGSCVPALCTALPEIIVQFPADRPGAIVPHDAVIDAGHRHDPAGCGGCKNLIRIEQFIRGDICHAYGEAQLFTEFDNRKSGDTMKGALGD